uniref:Glutathione peroxidase n=1 Tax=Neoseiulus barkeri TaxID=573039 RepID=A0A1C9EFZ3_9ACAR|nr:phospholipid hydroperoxide glutathione peroxidase 1 [Neoseiulus barkeri]
MASALRRVVFDSVIHRGGIHSSGLVTPPPVLTGVGAVFFSSSTMAKTIYDFVVKGMKGEDISLKKYEGKVCLIVNVASRCGLTDQYAGLQKLYDDHKANGLEILGFPCNQFGGQEPGTEEEIKSFCSLKYNVTFDMFKKIDVNGANASPLYKFLKSEQHGFLTDDIKWNFTKFLVDRSGKPVKRYAPQDSPSSLEKDIIEYLAKDSKL